MNQRSLIVGGAVLLLALVALGAYSLLQDLRTIPTAAQADVSFQTIPSDGPHPNVGCLNQAGQAGLAKELINIIDKVVVAGGSSNPMPDETWRDYRPGLPWTKNINRHTMFDDHCFYRSPTAPVDCQGAACEVVREVAGYSWIELAIVAAQDCVATGGGQCVGNKVDPGAISITVTQKCHQIVFNEEIYQLANPAGNLYVMHASVTGAPDLNPTLPSGWTLNRVPLADPLTVLPFGGGDNCYHNVLRDNLGQGYHQYVFAAGVYP